MTLFVLGASIITYNLYCLNFMAQIAKLTLCCLLLLILMLAGIVAGSRFGIIYAELEKIKRVQQPEETRTEKDIAQLQE